MNNNSIKSGITHQLRAWGRYKWPHQIKIAGHSYQQTKVLKHDFFALTALYECLETASQSYKKPPAKIVLKLARRSDFLGMPLGWLGRLITEHEISILTRLEHIQQVPRFLARCGDTGFTYEYIEGQSLDENPPLPNDFFNRLEDILRKIHACRIAYIDLNKRGNILLGHDNRPYIIDFQISYHFPSLPFPFRQISDFILKGFQREDFYHLLKHKRRYAGHLMEEEQIDASRQKSLWIRAHRKTTRPLTRLRRKILHFLFRTDRLIIDDIAAQNPESNPARWENSQK